MPLFRKKKKKEDERHEIDSGFEKAHSSQYVPMRATDPGAGADADGGWDLRLFSNSTTARSFLCYMYAHVSQYTGHASSNYISNRICDRCQKVCRDAMELICKEHHDDAADPYDVPNVCESCLNNHLMSNDGRCPVRSQKHGIHSCVFEKSVSIRRSVMNMRVECIHKYNKHSNNGAMEGQITTTMTREHPMDHGHGCAWVGVLKVRLYVPVNAVTSLSVFTVRVRMCVCVCSH